MNAFEVIKSVRLTEKGTTQSDRFNQYTVIADGRANKIQIRQAVQELFKVKVLGVNTLNIKGKPRQYTAGRVRRLGYDSNWKKAVVTLKKGDKINLT